MCYVYRFIGTSYSVNEKKLTDIFWYTPETLSAYLINIKNISALCSSVLGDVLTFLVNLITSIIIAMNLFIVNTNLNYSQYYLY
nr:MAG TPA: hypothetical protein [Caudoviricetes sp.]